MFNPKNIPEELKKFCQWVVWQKVQRNGKTTKEPINARTGYNARTNDRNSWCAFHEAMKYYEQPQNSCDGVGFIFTPEDPFVGIDLDHCIEHDGQLAVWATKIVEHFNSYTEISPSGTGLHILIKGKLPKGGRRKGGIEMYDSGRYFTMTGNLLVLK